MDTKRMDFGKWMWIAVVFILFVIFFLLNYYTPYLADDYSYTMHLKWGTNEKMTSFSDFLDSVRYFYHHWGGRIYGFCILEIISYLPPFLFDLLNTFIYLLMTYLVYAICKAGRSHNLVLYLFVHLSVWLLVPDYGQVMFWQSGSANYLWASVPILALLWLYRKNAVTKDGFMKSRWWSIPMFLLGMLAGGAMENMSAGMLVILVLSIGCFHRMKKLSVPYVSALIGALSGFSILFFAPGNGKRSEAEESLSVIFKFFIINYYWVMIFGMITVIWLILFCREYVAYRQKKILSEQGISAVIYLVAAICAAYCLIAANSIAERALFIVAIYLIIATGILAAGALEKIREKYRREIFIACIGAGVYFLVSACDTMICSREISVQTQQREAYILEQKKAGAKEIRTPIISISYPFRSKHDALEGLSDIRQDPDYWINAQLADYYGVDRIEGYYRK